jgi:hypothetical protein
MKKKENKEIATAQMAHLVFADTQPKAEMRSIHEHIEKSNNS